MFSRFRLNLDRAYCTVHHVGLALTTAYLIAMLTLSITVLDFLAIGHKAEA